MAENNRGRSPGTIAASQERAKSPDWSLADVNAARQTHTHLTGCQHIQQGAYAIILYASGRKMGMGLVTLALAGGTFAVRVTGSDRIVDIVRHRLRLPDTEELGPLSQTVPIPTTCASDNHQESSA